MTAYRNVLRLLGCSIVSSFILLGHNQRLEAADLSVLHSANMIGEIEECGG